MLQFGDTQTASVKPGLTDDDLDSVERNDILDLARAVEQIELGLQSTPLSHSITTGSVLRPRCARSNSWRRIGLAFGSKRAIR
jgi:hypothetical protein